MSILTSKNSRLPPAVRNNHRLEDDVTSNIEKLSKKTAREVVQVFKLFSDETRLRILHFLKQKEELNVQTICSLLNQTQPAVSHHLALLRVAGLIEMRRDGKHNYYRVVPDQFHKLLATMATFAPHADQSG